jgi:hypothetical protein
VFFISTGALVGITSVLLVLMLSGSRVLLAMARDGPDLALVLRRHPSELPHAAPGDDRDRPCRRYPRGAVSAQSSSPTWSTSAPCWPFVVVCAR